MTKLQARQIVLILAMKRIAFKLKREGNRYVVSFPQTDAQRVAIAAGA